MTTLARLFLRLGKSRKLGKGTSLEKILAAGQGTFEPGLNNTLIAACGIGTDEI
jgi:hypothetical protein